MYGCIGTDELTLDNQFSSSLLEKSLDIPFAVGKTVGEFKTVAGLDTFHVVVLDVVTQL